MSTRVALLLLGIQAKLKRIKRKYSQDTWAASLTRYGIRGIYFQTVNR
ncbi:hypothetical protein Plhal304r1_c042g0121961 [Plasmopara halstedii]